MEDTTQLFPIQVFMIIFCVGILIVLIGGVICLIRFERDLRYSIKSQKIWPKSNPIFTNINKESLPE